MPWVYQLRGFMNFQLIEKDLKDVVIGVSDFETIEALEEWKAKLIEANPGHTFIVKNLTIEVEAAKVKAEKKKSFKFKGKTIAELREEMNEWLEMQK